MPRDLEFSHREQAVPFVPDIGFGAAKSTNLNERFIPNSLIETDQYSKVSIADAFREGAASDLITIPRK
jgi:hypothetical protein